MMSFRNEKLKTEEIPMNIVKLIGKINEYKGKQNLYLNQAPQVLEKLKEAAIVQSTKSSNSIEGIVITDKRLKEIMRDDTMPEDRSEGEIAGYRDVLNTIHTSYDAIPINPNIILQFHGDLYKFISGEGEEWKNQDNVIEEVLPDGERYVRFRPLSAAKTPEAMEELCDHLNRAMKEETIEPLILIGSFVLDFLSIHPFNDGNGRIARLLTLLLLYKYEYKVGRYISLENIIEESKLNYYESLKKSSVGWHEGNHNLFIWLDYFLGTLLAAYKEFEDRVGLIRSKRGNKSYRVEQAIKSTLGTFEKEDIRNACPDVSESTINRVFRKLKEEGVIELLGKGRNAKWKRLE
ncbi:Fic family protein [Halarsenatibacter silvermanii]|uniref:Fic family protein n=1 Tax=Halarsenatibacter silvermanii TaxID=321763 RepID=A0A1G9PMN0_9FIRM|nr:Fic family protein [Halarsenatibacter silvermanii]SDL99823.1 Fic family protein [Halarsenatibacter silvermanii]